MQLQFHIKGALPLHHQVMPNYLFVIYASVLLLCTPSLGEFNIYDSLNKSAPVCNSTVYSSCYLSDIDNSTLTQGTNISYDGSLISKEGRFKLGFFERDGGAYLGIWYYNATNPESEEVIVWVANRDDPIPSQQQHSCYLALGEYGIARLLDSNGHTYWSTGNSSRIIRSTAILLRLLDTGNLILMVDRGTRSGAPIWQSFDNPTDTLLQGQGFGFINNENLNLKSWNGPDNPVFYNLQYSLTSSGQSFSISRITGNSASYYWKSSFSSLPSSIISFIQNETSGNSSQRLVMNVSGRVQLWELDQTSQRWSTLWMAPTDQCDANLVENCASFGLCDADNGFKCKCLPGFEPTYPQAWESKDFSDGCSRRRSTSEACGKMFLSLPMTKVPPNPVVSVTNLSEDECEKRCTFYESCKCKAYSYDPSAQSNCQIWLNNDLNNIEEEYYNPSNLTLSIRVAHSDIDFGKRACKICGSNVIPYPLSTSVNCGDPNYLRFQCNASNGQVYFESPIGKLYKISHISPADLRKFVVQLPQQGAKNKCDDTNNIASKVFKLNVSSPFKVTNCSIVVLMDKQVVEVELSWRLPPPPACNSMADCEDWPNTRCNEDANRTKVCTCIQGFHSDSKFMSCTKETKSTNSHHRKIVSLWHKAGIASACGILLLLGVIWFILHLRKRRTATKRKGITEFNKDNDIEDIDIPFVDYESILYATDNFSDANKLGVGGFGPVYKGLLVDGKAIAVKRLSATSVQGTEEFRNEVLLIAKLQHRNLVRLLGYCLKEDEKILIYEYMPNKSLDAFLFDLSASPVLDWRRRFNIIMGITRGLLYLHQDSRLRIIHRDLKPSNILLDEEWNPKISDFGLARNVQGNDMATTTARVIGTHGYMSPEYVLDGHFSIKSDVYSFGIVMLEIISGKRCTSLLGVDNNLISLLGYAWVLWDKGNPLELVDISVDSYDSCEVKRCINVGLLCVQEDPSDRPAMSNVLSMLSGDNTSLSYPKQPIFAARRRQPSEATSSSGKYGFSSNEVTVTLEGR